MELRLPPPLTPGSRVALVAPARFAPPELLESSAKLIVDWGFEPVIAEATRARDRQFGGTDDQRASALNAAFRDPNVGAVWALRGGYGCTRILPLLDGRALQAHPHVDHRIFRHHRIAWMGFGPWCGLAARSRGLHVGLHRSVRCRGAQGSLANGSACSDPRLETRRWWQSLGAVCLARDAAHATAREKMAPARRS